MQTKKNPGLIRRASGMMALEQRFMFDGAAVADALQVMSNEPQPTEPTDAAPETETVAVQQQEQEALTEQGQEPSQDPSQDESALPLQPTMAAQEEMLTPVDDESSAGGDQPSTNDPLLSDATTPAQEEETTASLTDGDDDHADSDAQAVLASDPTSPTLFLLANEGATENSQLSAALAQVQQRITDLLRQEDALAQLQVLFKGDAAEAGSVSEAWAERAQAFIDAYLRGERQVLLEVRSSSDLLGAYAAFAAVGPQGEPVIYLNDVWLARLTEDQLIQMLLEEVGHWIDVQLNVGLDSPGDEGEAFAASLLGLALSDAQRERIMMERDTVILTLDGVEVEVELASLLFSSASSYFIDKTASDPLTVLETNIVYTDGTVGPAGSRYLFVSDPEADPIFSGNNTRGYLYVVATDNRVSAAYFGEITRLYKQGGKITGLQFFAYPVGYAPGSGDRTTPTTVSILIDLGLGANFQNNVSYTTSSDPVAAALNKLLLPVPLTANADAATAVEAGGTSNGTAGVNPTGNIIANDTGGLDVVTPSTKAPTLTTPQSG